LHEYENKGDRLLPALPEVDRSPFGACGKQTEDNCVASARPSPESFGVNPSPNAFGVKRSDVRRKLMHSARTKTDSKPVVRRDGFGAAVLLRKKMEKRKSKLGKKECCSHVRCMLNRQV